MGLPGNNIIYNGPYKQPAALERAVDEGAMIQIDHLDELLELSAIAQRKNRAVDVAIRVFMDAGVRPVWSKFGFDADSNEAVQAIKRIHQSRGLRLTGLHTHVGTYITDPQVYARATNKLLDLAEIARREYQCDITYLNLGGGFASRSQLHYQYQSVDSVVPTMDAYAEAICKPITERWPKGVKLPRLYLETGRALVDEAGHLITTIVALKQAPTAAAANNNASAAGRDKSAPPSAASSPGAAGYLVDSGIHLLYTSAWFRHNVLPAKATPGTMSERTLFGCLCMNIDVLRQSVALPNMNVGDRLVFHPVGAYNITQSMQFITYRPRVVMIGEDGTVSVIRERENLEHIEALERLPEKLKL
jgi:diaminopimelate decarboxylase